jgi:Rrf2 family nitric oxide-sensitive transcriptional repressor
MRLTKLTSHGIRALIYICRADDRRVRVSEIAATLSISQQNAFKVVHMLARAGFVTGVRGRGGGIRLSRPAAEIRIGEIVKAVETTRVEVEDDPHPSPAQDESKGPLNRALDEALEAFIAILDQHTLAEMARAGLNEANILTPSQQDSPSLSGPKLNRNEVARQ